MLSTGRNAWAKRPAACIINSLSACWISVALIFSIETSATGGPRRAHADETDRDPLLGLFALGIGAHEAEDPGREVRLGGPDLLAGHHVVIALPDGARLERREVGARAGLGIALAPEVLALVYPRQVAILL